MTKEDEIMAFLNERVFDPILHSKTAPERVKRGVRLTVARMRQLEYISMIQYYWSSIIGTERSIDFASAMKDEGLIRFEEVIDDFRSRFSDEWIRKK